jgi:hypothetical protein
MSDPVFGPVDDKEAREVLWKECKRLWHLMGELERGVREIRKSLPSEDPLRMKLLTLETMAGIGLVRKRSAGAAILKRLQQLAEEDGFSLDAAASAETPNDD